MVTNPRSLRNPGKTVGDNRNKSEDSKNVSGFLSFPMFGRSVVRSFGPGFQGSLFVLNRVQSVPRLRDFDQLRMLLLQKGLS